MGRNLVLSGPLTAALLLEPGPAAPNTPKGGVVTQPPSQAAAECTCSLLCLCPVSGVFSCGALLPAHLRRGHCLCLLSLLYLVNLHLHLQQQQSSTGLCIYQNICALGSQTT